MDTEEIKRRAEEGHAIFTGLQQARSNPSGMCNEMAENSKPARPSLQERIATKRRRAEIESRKKEALMELEYLLDKNPEVARILDLMEQIGD